MSGPLFALALRQAASPRRLSLILLLAAMPLGIAALLRALGAEDAIVTGVLDALVVAVFLPIAVMTIATSAFGNEVEDRTLGLLTTKPVSPLAIVLAKLGAAMAVTAPLAAVVTAVVAALGSTADVGSAALAAGVGGGVGAIAYASIFTWAGLVSSRALGFALIYVLLWEALMSSLIEGVRYLSVRSYAVSAMHGLNEGAFEAFSSRTIDLPTALIGAALATVGFAYLTVRRLGQMDVP